MYRLASQDFSAAGSSKCYAGAEARARAHAYGLRCECLMLCLVAARQQGSFGSAGREVWALRAQQGVLRGVIKAHTCMHQGVHK